ncbi:glutaredoxin [Sphingorhabdus lutea]|uniref:Methylamine utilization protein MauE n=1 Tax=Sphingorhabdus lutea TaxID=1913578 RepID=A0A1L3JA47_9SPHN|nr:glutaredoxin [Sphingorhabdus lutea]APG61989.1 glutaredoxin [Sphingorhabdus lutea]
MAKTAKLYRMVMDQHICPYGLKSKYLLEREGFKVEDHHLTTREETDAFKEQHDVKTTPQTFIDGKRIGGHDDLRIYLGKDKPEEQQSDMSYQPVIALFAMMFLMALGAAFVATGNILSVLTAEWFVAFSMCGLAYLKLRDVESFSSMFLNYDLLAKRWVPYAYLYPFGEGLAGLLMIAGVAMWLAIPVALFIGTIGGISVFYAVYVQKRELKCACVGGDSNVPLGFISLTENIFMVGMAIWMLVKMTGI